MNEAEYVKALLAILLAQVGGSVYFTDEALANVGSWPFELMVYRDEMKSVTVIRLESK